MLAQTSFSARPGSVIPLEASPSLCANLPCNATVRVGENAH